MFVLFTIAELATLLVSIPESLGLLAFGAVLVAVAVTVRRLLNRVEDDKDKKQITKKAEVR